MNTYNNNLTSQRENESSKVKVQFIADSMDLPATTSQTFAPNEESHIDHCNSSTSEDQFLTESDNFVHSSGNAVNASNSRPPEVKYTSKKLKYSYTRRGNKIVKIPKQTARPRVTVECIIDNIRRLALLPEEQLGFYETQMKMFKPNQTTEDIKWREQDKEYALTVFHQCPNVYVILSTIFTLPPLRTLRHFISQQIEQNLQPGLYESTFQRLALKAKALTGLNNNCLLIYDKMSLRPVLSYNHSSDLVEGLIDHGSQSRKPEIATKVLVFMIQGIFKQWEQPISYLLTQDCTEENVLENIIKEIISKLKICGYRIRGVVCGPSLSNRNLFSTLNVSEDQPYFEFEGEKLYCFFDPPSLLKSLRDNFVMYRFELHGHNLDWQYLTDFFTRDSNQSISFARKLTNQHLHPTSYHKQRVQLAAELFSYTVAAGISLHVSLGFLPELATHTARFVEKVDRLFDVLNCSPMKTHKLLRRGLTESSTHVTVLEESAVMLKNLKVLCGEKKIDFIKDWLLSIEATCQLWKELKNDGATLLFTRCLNQRALKKMFCAIQETIENQGNPSPQKFKIAFKENLLNRYCSHNDNEDQFCDVSLFSILKNITGYFEKATSSKVLQESRIELSMVNPEEEQHNLCPTIKIKFEDALNQVDSFGKESDGVHFLNYVVSSVIEKVMPKHNCAICGDVCGKIPLDNSQMLTCSNAQYTNKSNFSGLTYPSDSVMEYMLQVEKTFVKEFNKNIEKEGLCSLILARVAEIDCNKLCDTFKNNLAFSYVRIRLYCAVNYLNLQLKETKVTAYQSKGLKLKKIIHLAC